MINLHSPSLSTVKTDQDTQCENRVVEWVQIDNCFNRNFSEQDEFKPENKASINEIMGGKLKWRKQLIKQLEKQGRGFQCVVVFLFVVLILMYKEVLNSHFDPTFLMVNIQSSPQLQTLQKLQIWLSYVCTQFLKT